jgi:hypothetical protein
MPDPKPHHRRAAAEAWMGWVVGPVRSAIIDGWIESGGYDPSTTTERTLNCVAVLEPIAQAIADAEEQGRQSANKALQTLVDGVHGIRDEWANTTGSGWTTAAQEVIDPLLAQARAALKGKP